MNKGNVVVSSGEGKLVVVQRSVCHRADISTNFNALLTSGPQWQLQMSEAADIGKNDSQGRCHARSKATIIISTPQKGTMIKLRIWQVSPSLLFVAL